MKARFLSVVSLLIIVCLGLMLLGCSLGGEMAKSAKPGKSSENPINATYKNVDDLRYGDWVRVTGRGELYKSYGHKGKIYSHENSRDNSLRVNMPREMPGFSYPFDIDAAEAGDFAGAFSSRSPIEFGRTSTVTVVGKISGIQRAISDDSLLGFDLDRARVEDVVFD